MNRDPEIGAQITYGSVRSSMERERARTRPTIPESLAELGEMLETYAATSEIYQGMVAAADGSRAVMFAAPRMLRELGESSDLYVDGTFKVSLAKTIHLLNH